MPTAVQNLQTAYDQMAARLVEMTANPKPSYTEQGRSRSWTEYQKFLLDGMKLLREQMIQAGGPYAIVTRGRA